MNLDLRLTNCDNPPPLPSLPHLHFTFCESGKPSSTHEI